MRILRVIRKGVYELYAILNGKAYRLAGMDPLEVLERYLEGGLEKLGERAELDLEAVLRSRDPAYKVAKPIDPPEVWGAGITYQAARASYAGGEIASIRGRSVYELVYESDRPELFLKDAGGRRCAAHQDPIVVRSDSRWTLPEPELAVILGGDGRILGYTIANDVTTESLVL
ncbi:MAG: hypothetical protein QXQ57_03590 [Sulfolobales archaeon]